MSQIIEIIKRKYWRKKKKAGGRSIQQPESVWVDIAKRTAKTFVQVSLGVLAAALADVPQQWKLVITGAVTTGACVAMNYAINRIRDLIGDPDADYTPKPVEIKEKEDDNDSADQQTGEG